MANQPIVPPNIPPGMKPIAPPTVPSAPGKPPGPPPMVAKGAPLPPGVKPAAAGQPPVEGEEEDSNPGLGFWQQPWVQNVLPFVTSLAVHAGIVILALLVFVASAVIKKAPTQEQVIIPDSQMVENGPPGGIPNIGLGGDPLREAAQDKDPTSKTKDWADKKGPTVDIADAGGGAGDNTAGLIQVGAGQAFGSGSGQGAGNGSGHGGGSGDSTGPMAMFGTPGGGGLGIKGPVFGNGGNARQIVFLCDSTGSMINKMATLKDELNKAVSGLKPIQSFDIVFYQDVKIDALAPALIPATPESKRKAGTYLEAVTATGTTNPLPGLEMALKLHPQIMFFLTDAADFPDPPAVEAMIKKYNTDKKIRVNTILFVQNKNEHDQNIDSEAFMKKIATDNGGNFRWVEIDSL
ncbi:MAG TPA: hypothetical protein VFE47_03885 [Tepidisphaeraceae bacterium]|jgi:hypothetical protein|nr:hypothetical protein [Tepidisphaeraceae bacterium]